MNDNETVEQIHDELKRDPLAENGAKPWIHYPADRIFAEYRREIAARDEEIAKLRALVGEMADALDLCIGGFETIYDEECTDHGTGPAYDNAKRVVARAREVVK